MSDEISKTNKAIELSQQELDAVAGGSDVSFSFSFFQENDKFLSQEASSGKNGSSAKSVLQSRNIVSYAFQFIGLDIGNATLPKGLFGR